MRGLRGLVLALTLHAAWPALAQPLDTSPRPRPRPDPAAVVLNDKTPELVVAPSAPPVPNLETLSAPLPAALTPRPPRRPATLERPAATPAPAPQVALINPQRPPPRPTGLGRSRPKPTVQTAAAPLPAPGMGALVGRKGSVCGIPAIQGQTIAPIVGRIAGCGVAKPVRITSVAGVRLTQPATVNCETAKALNTWVERGLKPAFGSKGGGVVAITVPAHYACRTRNHKKGARLSEHAKGNAVDVSIIHLANGQQVSVLRGWRSEYGKALKSAHRAACGIFGTTLGPGSDGMHEDHFHYDVARHRSGSYCR